MKYRKKSVVVEAVQFCGSSTDISVINEWMVTGVYKPLKIHTRDYRPMQIQTLEGVMTANPHDWIIKGVAGEFYPCKPDIFEMTYEAIKELP